MKFFSRHEKIKTREVTTEFVLRDKNGNVKPLWNENLFGRLLRTRFNLNIRGLLTGFYADRLLTHNLITNIGHAAANGRMSNQGGYSPFTNLGIGLNTSSAAATDQALGQEITANGGARAAATATQVTTTVTNDTTQLVKTWNFTASFAITEEGIFDASAAPTVTTLNGAITSGATSITVTSGTGITNNDYIQIDNEILQVTAGGGTTTLTVTRAQKGTTAAAHSNAVGVVDINTSANMLAKQTFAAVNVNSGDSLQVTHKYQS